MKMSREDQAQYADAVCVAMAQDRRFLTEQLDSIKTLNGCDYPAWNATSIGNIAYLLLYSPLENEERDSLENLLTEYGKWKVHKHSSRIQSSCSVS